MAVDSKTVKQYLKNWADKTKSVFMAKDHKVQMRKYFL